MDYGIALSIGRARAETAAEALGRWTGVEAMAVCAVKAGHEGHTDRTGDWEPVGERSFKEVARDDGFAGGGNYHLLVVDERGVAKACTRKRFPLDEVLKLAERLPLPVATQGRLELSMRLQEKEMTLAARDQALRVDL